MSRSISSPKSIQKAREVARKILESSPALAKDMMNNSLIRNSFSHNVHPPVASLNQSPYFNTESSGDSSRKFTRPTMQSMNMNMSQKANIMAIEWQRKYAELDIKYRKLENEFIIFKSDEKTKEERYIKREFKFKQLIMDLEDRIYNRDPILSNNDKQGEIEELHNTVLEKIDGFQNKTSKIMVEQEKDVVRFFENKLNEIKTEYESEKTKFIEKNEKFAIREANLIAEVEWIKEIASKIDHENQNLSKKYQDLKTEYGLRADEEALRREQVVLKRKVTILESKLQQYEEIFEEYGRNSPDSRTTPIPAVNESLSAGMEPKFLPPIDQNLNISMRSSPGRGKSGRSTKLSNNYSMSLKSSGCAALDVSQKSIDLKADHVISQLKDRLMKEKRQKQEFKSAYIKELENKNDLEKLIRECVQGVRAHVSRVQREKINLKKQQANQSNVALDESERSELIERLIHDERILAQIYDKAFHAKKKKVAEKHQDSEIDLGDEEQYRLALENQ